LNYARMLNRVMLSDWLDKCNSEVLRMLRSTHSFISA